MEREEIADVLEHEGLYDENTFSRLDLLVRPSWRQPFERLSFEIGWFGTSGFQIYHGPLDIGIAVHRGSIDWVTVYGTPRSNGPYAERFTERAARDAVEFSHRLRASATNPEGVHRAIGKVRYLDRLFDRFERRYSDVDTAEALSEPIAAR